MHIGQRIKEVMAKKKVSVIAIAKEIECERTNVYNIFAREEYRHHSMITSACRGMVCGLGLQGYKLALQALLDEGVGDDQR